MTISLLRFRARDGHLEDVVEYYRAERILERSSCASGQLMTDADDPSVVTVIAHWASPEDYDAWVADPLRADSTRAIMPFIDPAFAPIATVTGIRLQTG